MTAQLRMKKVAYDQERAEAERKLSETDSALGGMPDFAAMQASFDALTGPNSQYGHLINATALVAPPPPAPTPPPTAGAGGGTPAPTVAGGTPTTAPTTALEETSLIQLMAGNPRTITQ